MTLTGTKLVHVPYKGDRRALTDLVAGHVDLSFIQFSAVHELQQAASCGCWRSPPTSASRSARRPDHGGGGPARGRLGDLERDQRAAEDAGPIVPKLNAAINEALQEPEVLARFRELQVLVGGGDADRDEEVRRGAARALGQGDPGRRRAAAMRRSASAR